MLALPRTYVPMMGSLGPEVARFVKACAALFFGTVALGGALLVRRLVRGPRGDQAPFRPALAGVLATGAVAYAVVLFLCVYFWRRVPRNNFV